MCSFIDRPRISQTILVTTTKFDFLTKREWESRLKANELPTWKQMVEFLKQRCLTLEPMLLTKLLEH